MYYFLQIKNYKLIFNYKNLVLNKFNENYLTQLNLIKLFNKDI